ncbi:DUF1800 family protein [Sphingomonas sp. BK580]|uniref:DUF1800 domain-containing protein n=1 Tax=Sphingomonas sp. BK580 TaxID=2586972 RepID=UPI00162253B8|nr:DUF1800 family protein [Sphingomonas sp. BK580]MBB3694664.1 uncharacterized protein (DUF1800 family) [Sphingomonas sp. BK580]
MVTPTPAATTAPDSTPSSTPTPAAAQPAGGFAYLTGLASDLADTIANAFWRFLALFTADGTNLAWSNGLTAFRQPVLSASGAAAVPPDVVRLARQATFGPNPQVVARISELGVSGWVDEQFTLRGSTYKDLIEWVPANYCSANPGVPKCVLTHFNRARIAARFYADATMAPDQLRQRVAFALSQILVVSNPGDSTAGLASYQQMLLDNAFGNYGELLQGVTLHGYMGRYLNMAESARAAPSENYARELLQLFSMGPVQLARDGTPVTDSGGRTLPNYSTEDVRGVARALTGWTYAHSGGRTDWIGWDFSLPMVPAATSKYDGDAKSFLGTSVPAGASPADSVRAVVAAAFNHPSTPPRIAKLLIQNLVTANPSRGYVGRVASVFENNGSGVRGDLKAVVRAILLDPEARGDEPRGDAGKVKEPILVMTSLARAIGLSTDGIAFVLKDVYLGQPVFSAPSVFNFYPPDYPLARARGLVSPESKLLSAGNVTEVHNLVFNWTLRGDANRQEYSWDMGLPNFTGTQPRWTGWDQIATDVDRLVAVTNLLLLDNSATSAQLSALRSALLGVRHNDPAVQAHKRAQAALYIAATSPNFLVDR